MVILVIFTGGVKVTVTVTLEQGSRRPLCVSTSNGVGQSMLNGVTNSLKHNNISCEYAYNIFRNSIELRIYPY